MVEEEVKWLKHYSSSHKILLVGEGDFSFSLCLANSFGSASNILATSLDSYASLIKKYNQAKSNLENLEKLGASLLHGVDATRMKFHTDLQMRKFDRIIFNFPHAGFHGKEDEARIIDMHRNLVSGFFRNARGMLRANGEIHVNHKTTAPFCYWNLHELAMGSSLIWFECVDFKKEDFPGYNNKKGDGSKCDVPFPLGKCGTFKFIASPTAINMPRVRNMDSTRGNSQTVPVIPLPVQTVPVIPLPVQCQPISFGLQPALHSHGTPLHIDKRNECFRIFGEYLDHATDTFGRTDINVSFTVHEALRLGCARYMAEDPRRSLSDYISILEELQHLSSLKSMLLQQMLSSLDEQLSGLLKNCQY